MRRLFVLLATLAMAWPAMSQTASVGIGSVIKDKNSVGYTVELNASKVAGTYVIGESFPKAVVGFDLGSAFDGTLYACETPTYSAGTCTAFGTTLDADVDSVAFDTARRWYVLTITTAETGANVSYLTIYGTFDLGGGGGGGVVGSGTLAEMLAYPNPDAGDLWQQTDDNGTADCATDGGTDSALLCQWSVEQNAWVAAGVAGGTDNLGNHTATTDLNLNANSITGAVGVATKSIDGSVFYASQYATGSDTGGIVEALAACETAGGGTVKLPAGNTAIDATSLTSPIIALPFDTDGAGYALCTLEGHGDNLIAATGGGSTLTFANLQAKVGIHVTASRQILRGFTVKVTQSDADTIGILFQSADTAHTGCSGGTCDPGEAGINNWTIENVSVSGPAAGGPGVGVEFQFALKGIVLGGEIQKWDTGVHYAPVDGLTGTFLPNAANVWTGTKIRENDDGFVLSGYSSACSSVTFSGLTIEGNEDGFVANSNSDCFVTDIGSYYEQSFGTQASRRNIGWDSTGGNYYGVGVRFSTSGVDAGRDFVASANQFANYGPHTFIAGFFGNGITSAGEVRLISPRYIGAASASGSGAVYGTLYYHATDCPTWGASSDSLVSGDACWEADSNTIYICEPDADGTCDDSAEWISQKQVDYVWTGAHDFGGGVLEVPNSAAPTTDATGEIALDTTITDHQPLLQYYDGGENMTVIAIDTSQLPAQDDEIVKYDAATDKFVLEADSGSGSFDATTVDAVTWSDGANASNAWTFNVSGTDPVVTWGNGTVDFSTPITATNFVADPSDTGEMRLTSATGSDEIAIGLTDNGTSTSMDFTVDDGTGDDQQYLLLDGANAMVTASKPIQLGAAGVRLTGDGDGAVTLLGLGNGSDEDLTLNLDDTANTVAVSSSTGVNLISAPGIGIDLGTGAIRGAVAVVVTTGGSATADGEGEFHIADHGTATSDTTYTLPAAAAGMSACFYDNGAGTGGITIDVDAADVILLNGTPLDAGDTIDSPGVAGDGANGDFICLLAIDATNWITLGQSGTWVDGGAS